MHVGVDHLVRLHNSKAESVTLFIEPWGDQIEMAPEAIFEIVASGPVGGKVELEICNEGFVIYGWSGSTIAITQDGRILRNAGPPAPEPPGGSTVKEFVDRMFKKEEGQDH